MINLFKRRQGITPVLQSQASECGLACMTMIAKYHGHDVDIGYMRALFPVSRRGMTLKHLVELGDALNLNGRGFAIGSVEELSKVALPAILHWNGDHFVVLESITSKGYTIQDPAFGTRYFTAEDLRRQYSGVVLEFEPRLDFTTIDAKSRSQLWKLFKTIKGLESTVAHVAIVSVAVSLLGLMTPILLQVALDEVIPQFDLDLLTIVCLGLAAFNILDAFGKWFRDNVILKSTILFQTYFTRNIIGHAMRLPVKYFEERHPGDLVARLDSIEHVKTYMVTGLVAAFADTVMVVLAVGLMSYYSPTMTGVVVGALTAVVIMRVSFLNKLKSAAAKSLEAHSQERERLLDALRGIQSLKIHNAGEASASRWFESFVNFANADYMTKGAEYNVQFLLHVMVALATVFTLYLGVTNVMQSTMSIGMLYGFFALRQVFFDKIDNLTTQLMHLSIMGVHLRRIDDIIDQKPEAGNQSSTMNRIVRSNVKLENVTVQFSRADEPVLSNVNLTIDIAKNESLAIIGASGAGKSSLLRVLSSLHEPYSGTISVDGQGLDRFGLREYRNNIGAVFADDVIFAASVLDNITLFHPDVSREMVEEALNAVGLLEEIQRLPQGLATKITAESNLLSTGQRRRVLAARAICRNPRLFLFDEITANLDPESEASLVANMLAVPGAKVFVTHSRALLSQVDKVYAVRDGALVLEVDNRTKPRQAA